MKFKKIAIPAIAGMMLAVNSLPVFSAEQNLSAHYNFEESKSFLVNDIKNNIDGKMTNMKESFRIKGVNGQGLFFDGLNGVVTIPTNDMINFGKADFSISFWMAQNNSKNNGRYILKGSYRAPKSGKRFELFRHSSSKIRFTIDDNITKTKLEVSDKNLVNGKWVFVTAVRDTKNKELRLYADGKLLGKTEDKTGDISQEENMYLGGSPDEGSYFQGFMDEVKLHNKALSNSEIKAEYQKGIGANVPKQPEGTLGEIERPRGSDASRYNGTPAFPGAIGYGIATKGGRGGKVYKVTNLEDSGPGSLRAAVEAKEARTVVFDVSGTIKLKSELRIANDNITIAGQTAPGDGITLRDYGVVVDANEVIVRYLRVRMGDEAKVETDSIWLSGGNNIVFDHCSASWSVDETFSVSQGFDRSKKFMDNVTVQWSIISESLNKSLHAKGNHGYGSLIRGHDGSKYSFNHNLWAHHRARMPRPGNYEKKSEDTIGAFMDFRNNVFYGWGAGRSGYNADTNSISQYNFINNYYVAGVNSKKNIAFDEGNGNAKAFFAGNYMNHKLPKDPWSLVTGIVTPKYKLNEPINPGTTYTDEAKVSYERVLKESGASLFRDSVDERIIKDVVKGTGTFIDHEEDVNGWPVLKSKPAPLDSDNDGMPDKWEEMNGLDKNNYADNALDNDKDGYTNLEEYLNSLVPNTSKNKKFNL